MGVQRRRQDPVLCSLVPLPRSILLEMELTHSHHRRLEFVHHFGLRHIYPSLSVQIRLLSVCESLQDGLDQLSAISGDLPWTQPGT